MARRCTNDGSPGKCCQAFSQGIRSGQTFTYTDRNGHARCASCSIRQSHSKRHPGKQVFQFKFEKNASCGIVSGCPALAQGGGGGGVLQLPAPGQVPSL